MRDLPDDHVVKLPIVMKKHTAANAKNIEDVDILKLKIKELEDVNHMMVHNLRGAAANVMLLTEILLDRKNGPEIPDDPGQLQTDGILSEEQILECISQSGDAMVKTLDNMLETVNNSLNEKTKYEDCDVEGIVRNIVKQLNGFMFQKGARIMLHLTIKHFNYAKSYLESLLYNLIHNSIKYSRPGVPLEINISTHEESGRTILELKDNGLGIDMEKQGDKLFKLNQTFHGGEDSHGIGLYMTREQIESLGGHIEVKSKVNAGTEFTVVL